MHTFHTAAIEHVNLKIFAKPPAPARLDPAIAIFHRWIQDSVCEELLIDVADYRHVPEGPGVILIGHEANYSLDCASGRLGLLYSRKAVLGGNLERKLSVALRRTLWAASMMEQDPAFAGSLAFDAGDWEVIFNDRLLAPNTPETWIELQPLLREFFGRRLGAPCSLSRVGEAGERLRASVQASRQIRVEELPLEHSAPRG